MITSGHSHPKSQSTGNAIRNRSSVILPNPGYKGNDSKIDFRLGVTSSQESLPDRSHFRFDQQTFKSEKGDLSKSMSMLSESSLMTSIASQISISCPSSGQTSGRGSSPEIITGSTENLEIDVEHFETELDQITSRVIRIYTK